MGLLLTKCRLQLILSARFWPLMTNCKRQRHLLLNIQKTITVLGSGTDWQAQKVQPGLLLFPIPTMPFHLLIPVYIYPILPEEKPTPQSLSYAALCSPNFFLPAASEPPVQDKYHASYPRRR